VAISSIDDAPLAMAASTVRSVTARQEHTNIEGDVRPT
jgi:hypothetical protein